MKNKEESEKLVRVTINIPKYKKEMITKVVEKSSYNNVSELVRAGIDKELNIQMYKDSLDFIIKELDCMHKEFIQMLNDARIKANYYISRDIEEMTKKDLFDFYTIGEPYRNE